MTTAEERVAALAGLTASYRNQKGDTVATSRETRRAVLAALRLDVSSDRAAEQTLRRLESARRAALPPIIVVEAGTPTTIEHPALAGRSEHQAILLEDGSECTARVEAGRLSVPALPAGYHSLAGSSRTSCFIFSAPSRCWKPTALDNGARLWGVAAQVYSLRRAQDFGMGDLGHVRDLSAGCARSGASFVGLSPLHALFPHDRSKISPYSPSTRLFIDPLYIDPERIEGWIDTDLAQIRETEAFRSAMSRASGRRLVDYGAVWVVKEMVLRALWRARSHAIRNDPHFRAFVSAQGELLENHATFDALSAHFAEQGLGWSGAWPRDFEDPHGAAVRTYRGRNEDEILYRCWLQFVADAQLAATAEASREAGMEIGLYRDLAVGADLFGSERWSDPDAWCGDLSIGAPPDPLGPKGQNWGLPPLDPLAQLRTGLTTFRALVRANMRHAGALRIDHAFQLQRLFVIPRGRPAGDGAYLDYPFAEMLAVLRIESHRARCAVIGEDLGNGPEGFSAGIVEQGIFSYRILAFERTKSGAVAPPAAFPALSLASINTHDLPTFAGWWRGLDIDLRECFGVYDRSEWTRERVARSGDKADLLTALRSERLAGSDPASEPDVREATLRYLARTHAALVVVGLEDVDGEINQPNLPGLADGYPNWRRRLDASLETLVAPGGPLARVSTLFGREERGAHPPRHKLALPPPRATYRLQLHKGFTFDDAGAVVPQLASLGVSHIYVSPITTARPGSMHGYDVIDPTRINLELGGEEGFLRFSDALQRAGLGLIVDIVPNHMGVGSDNPWWLSVLEWGRASPFAAVFDINWDSRPDGKLLLPILGEPLEDALRAGKFALRFDEEESRFWVVYFETRLPVCPGDYGELLRAAATHDADETAQTLNRLADRFDTAVARDAPSAFEQASILRADLAGLARGSRSVAHALENVTAAVSTTALAKLIDRQRWRAAWWRSARADINYRRFFEIDSLAGVRVEDPRVFAATHDLLFKLVDANRIQGLRVDHIDGLADPAAYLERLQARVGPGFYIVVEKILEAGEKLPPWPVAGTTGYDALASLDAIFVHSPARQELDRLVDTLVPGQPQPSPMLTAIKAELCESDFPAELGAAVQKARAALGEQGRWADLSIDSLRRAIVAWIAHFPRYRTYLRRGPPDRSDAAVIAETCEALRADPMLDPLAVESLFHLMTTDGTTTGDAAALLAFRERLQQLSGPVMAKGQEDTLFYRWNRLIALNEVGADPSSFGLSPARFHAANLLRLQDMPASLVATSTHDTKRGEDARARILALGARPDDVAIVVRSFVRAANESGCTGLDPGDALMLAQAIVGAWPADPDAAMNAKEFRTRLCDYAVKALREAKLRSSWLAPDLAYEELVCRALECVVAADGAFAVALRPLLARVDIHGMWIALGRTVLKCLAPGIPDFYQGCEVWNQALVDPDNRRPAPFAIPAHSEGELSDLLPSWRDGRVKRELTRRLLALRAADPDLFAFGSYEPIECGDAWIGFHRGEGSRRLSIFARRAFDHQWMGPALSSEAFADLPSQIDAGSVRNLLRSELIRGTPQDVASLFGGMPFAVLRKK